MIDLGSLNGNVSIALLNFWVERYTRNFSPLFTFFKTSKIPLRKEVTIVSEKGVNSLFNKQVERSGDL